MIFCLDTDILLKTLFETTLLLDSSYESARISGEIYAGLKSSGRLINDADILIAGIVKSHNATLVTNNISHFERIDGLAFDNWL